MAWFKRTDKGIQTSTEDKKDTPKGLWYKTPSGKVIDTEELKRILPQIEILFCVKLWLNGVAMCVLRWVLERIITTSPLTSKRF